MRVKVSRQVFSGENQSRTLAELIYLDLLHVRSGSWLCEIRKFKSRREAFSEIGLQQDKRAKVLTTRYAFEEKSVQRCRRVTAFLPSQDQFQT
jgi:hypothetical protein